MDTYAFSSTTQLIKALQDKNISSLELLEYFIERYERLNPGINAIISTDIEGARIRAQEADEASFGGQNWGPLHGLPMTIKDSFEVVGMPCTSGAPDLKTYMPTRNAAVVEALIQAGAVVFGKTNLPLFAMDMQSYNDVYGQTNNPWDTTKVPGGSSGGAAAALAAGITGLELGSDIGGSIRNPAHFCGVYGHKPSFNIISLQGHIPPFPGLFPGEYSGDGDLAVAGPLARSVDDLELVMDVITRPKPFQQLAIKIELPPPRKISLREFRVGLWLDDTNFPVDTQVGDCLQAAVHRLIAAGAQVEDKRPEIDYLKSHEIYTMLLHATSSPGLPENLYQQALEQAKSQEATDMDPMARWARGTTIRFRDWSMFDYQRLLMRQQWADYFRDFDVLLCPAMPITAFSHDHSDFSGRTLLVNGEERNYGDTALSWAGLTGVSYLPATVAPVGIAENGLPVGMQIVGPYLEDKTPIHFARLMADVLGGFTPPPGFD